MLLKLLILILLPTMAMSSEMLWGEKVTVGNGYAQSYVQLKNDKSLAELGVVLSPDALTGLGNEGEVVYNIDLPTGLKIAPYDHITLNWNPHGHDPNGVYDKPHFDFHFYFITKSQQLNILCSDDDAAVCIKPIANDYLVDGYIPTPEGVPYMGWHWVDSRSREFHGLPFTYTFIYGYYDGKPNFIEPMITLDYLKSKKAVTSKIRLPAKFAIPGAYPSSYSVGYDHYKMLHFVTLRKFKNFE